MGQRPSIAIDVIELDWKLVGRTCWSCAVDLDKYGSKIVQVNGAP